MTEEDRKLIRDLTATLRGLQLEVERKTLADHDSLTFLCDAVRDLKHEVKRYVDTVTNDPKYPPVS